MRLLLFLFFFPVLSFAQSQPGLVPVPANYLPGEIVQTFELYGVYLQQNKENAWTPAEKQEWLAVASLWRDKMQAWTGTKQIRFGLADTAAIPDGTFNVFLITDSTAVEHPEGYVLGLGKELLVFARRPAGAFYALQTFGQLLADQGQLGKGRITLHGFALEDSPRFAWRGLHLDVCRHFFSVDFVKKYIDLLAAHKLNVFHWHLTDDQGWRIDIQKYPRLRTVAACRPETLVGHYNDQPRRFDGKRYCGYYSEEDIKDVVEYARQRFVTVVPEIEMPGHALAALSAYPELGCTGGPYTAATYWGVFDDVFCPGRDETFDFIENVLDEVCALFPGKYIHIGGDECPKTRWRACERCQARMQAEGLKDEHELQSYFIHRVEKMLALRGKKLIGWDEILEGGLAPDATVMSWRGTSGGIAAAKAGHDAVMTPTSHCYFDYYQSAPENEPLAIGGFLPLEKVYGYEPVPAELGPDEARHVLGVQANLWTEYIDSPEKVEYMIWPRAAALAEIAWSTPEKRSWPDFARRLKRHFAWLDARGVNYSKAYFDVRAALAEGRSVRLYTPDSTVQIRYTLDNTTPDAKSKRYTGPIALAQDRSTPLLITAASFDGTKRLGQPARFELQPHLAFGKAYKLSTEPSVYTAGEPRGLTNGRLGDLRGWDHWVGLAGANLDPVIDLGKWQTVRQVSLHFVNAKDSWIWPPRRVVVAASDDGLTFTEVSEQEIDTETLTGASVEEVIVPINVKMRYVRVLVENYGPIPAGRPGEGNGAWVFVDEIVVE